MKLFPGQIILVFARPSSLPSTRADRALSSFHKICLRNLAECGLSTCSLRSAWAELKAGAGTGQPHGGAWPIPSLSWFCAHPSPSNGPPRSLSSTWRCARRPSVSSPASRTPSLSARVPPDLVHSHSFHANIVARLLKPFVPAAAVLSTVHNVMKAAGCACGPTG